MSKITLTIPTTFKARHRWKDAPHVVKFLRELHPHVFHVTVITEVTHDDRAIEFYMARSELDLAIQRILDKWDNKWSCEQIAQEIHRAIYLSKQFKNTEIESVSVSEDGIFGATYYPDNTEIRIP